VDAMIRHASIMFLSPLLVLGACTLLAALYLLQQYPRRNDRFHLRSFALKMGVLLVVLGYGVALHMAMLLFPAAQIKWGDLSINDKAWAGGCSLIALVMDVVLCSELWMHLVLSHKCEILEVHRHSEAISDLPHGWSQPPGRLPRDPSDLLWAQRDVAANGSQRAGLPVAENAFPGPQAALGEVRLELEDGSSGNGDSAPDDACCVCLTAQKDTFAIPCRHQAMCYNCAVRIIDSNRPECPICRKPMQDVLQVFRS